MKYLGVDISFFPFCWRLTLVRPLETRWKQFGFMVGPLRVMFFNAYWPNKEGIGGLHTECKP